MEFLNVKASYFRAGVETSRTTRFMTGILHAKLIALLLEFGTAVWGKVLD